MNSTSGSDRAVQGVDDVLITAELASRFSPSPDYEAESRALGILAHEMTTNPRGVLQKCAEMVMELCHADSAGVSVLEPGGTSGVLRWRAAAGGFAANLHGAMPREASPCGTVMERDRILLFNEAERFFPALQGVEPRIYENLLAPWHVKGEAVGTLWAIKHTPEGRFNAEDARILQSLARFAAAAFQMTSALDEVTAERSALRMSERKLRESEARLAHDLEATQLLQRIGNDLVSTTGPNGHFGRICAAARALMRSDAASLQLLDKASSRLKLVGHTGFHPESAACWAWVDAGTESVCGRALAAGERLVVADIATFEASPADHAAWRQSGIQSVQSTPLVARSGQVVGMMSTHWGRPHQPSDGDYRFFDILARLAADFIERSRAEAALAESEERFQQFADASAAGLWIREANSLEAEFASPAIATIYGVAPDALLGDVKRWAALVVPEERDAALAQIEAARGGETAVHEFRIQRPSDRAFRWIRDTSFPLEDGQGQVERIGGIAEDITEAKRASEHQSVLLAELQHRVRNIMAVIRSMALRTADRAADVVEYRSSLEGRLMALARVQALLTRETNAGGSLRDIIANEVSAQAHRDDQFELSGPEIRLSPKAVEVLTLAIHELATNAVKYGAFSVPRGRLRVSWQPFEQRGGAWLALDWKESGAPPSEPSKRRGFGSDLIEGLIPYELGGMGKITLEPGGAHCRMEFPLRDGESILETDAPLPTTIFGGSLDMLDAPDLTGRKVLVVEDDCYVASDTAAALRGAGAEVLGPCSSEEATLDLLESQTPTHAMLDLNLGGGGPKFEIARLLKASGVPFVFITGYDPEKIPPEFEEVPRLQKPVPFRQMVEALHQV